MENSKPKDPAMWHVHCLHEYTVELLRIMNTLRVRQVMSYHVDKLWQR